MASALLENLSAAAALSASDLFYVKQAGARGLKATGTQLLALVGTAYVPLAGGASMAGPLSLVNSTNAQTFNIYNTYTDSNNYERGFIKWDSNALKIGNEKLGSGSTRELHLITPEVMRLYAGNFNFYDAGLSFAFTIGPISNGVMKLSNSTGSDFGRVCFGGTTTSYPAIKRSAATIAIRLGDDSGAAGLSALYVQTPGTTVAGLVAAATAGAGARAFVTDASATTFLSTVAGGGANKVPVVSDGTNWLIG